MCVHDFRRGNIVERLLTLLFVIDDDVCIHICVFIFTEAYPQAFNQKIGDSALND